MALKRDLKQCIKCKLSEPLVKIPLLRGKPRGICTSCRNLQERQLRSKAHLKNDFYESNHVLNRLNFDTLASLADGAYSLIFRPTKTQKGYLIIADMKVFIKIGALANLYIYDLFAISTLISNFNLVLERNALEVQTASGEPIDLAEVGAGMPLEDPNDRLVMFDLKLRDYAVAKVRKEIEEAKREAALAIAASQERERSLNPKK